jgi:hypothetical protein
LNFPRGNIDAPNALAYALLLKPGRLIYEGWNPNAHIEAGSEIKWNRPVYLTANATRSAVAACLCQTIDGRTVVHGDWIAEGDPGAALQGVVREASLMAGGATLTLVAGQRHWEQYQNVGLVQGAQALGIECRHGGDLSRGRGWLRKRFERGAGALSFAISPSARWTLNSLAGGYSMQLRDGALVQEPANNHYRLLMEGLEGFAALLDYGIDDEGQQQNWAIDREGRRYKSALARLTDTPRSAQYRSAIPPGRLMQ